MAKKVDKIPDPDEALAPICRKCENPITNPNGDNGCGYHTVAEKPFTNCVPVEKMH